jgi:murein DD-endopeptidase MepM/ murein hydrolase activator NlpD
LRTGNEEYVVQSGDTLNQIALQHAVSVNAIAKANNLDSTDYLDVGKILSIPPPEPQETGPDFKIIPDSELVYGPSSTSFDVVEFIKSQDGYLANYEELVGERTLSGAKIVKRVAEEFSVNPRLLLSVLEYRSGWVTRSDPPEATLDSPIGSLGEWRSGLYNQLAWAADNLNRGYYLWRVNGLAAWILADGNTIPINPTINAGTAGVQHFFAQLLDRKEWKQAVSEGGLFATYNALFGYPFQFGFDPLLPQDLSQPTLQLPFERGETWAYTGGPHGGLGSGSAWAALDFAPPGEALGCIQSDAWVTAVADGMVVRTGNGAVVQDLDGDELEQTGWTILYMHIENREQVSPGTDLKAGERVGHPSCEGGFSTGTHLHIARRYNGEWIPADQSLPFVLDKWVSVGLGKEYDGYLKKNDKTVEAWEGRSSKNAIKR